VRVEFVESLSCSERFFSGYSGFPLLLKNQHFQIPIRPRMAVICAWHKIPHICVITRRPSVLVSKDFRRLPQIPQTAKEIPKTSEDVRRLSKMSKGNRRFPRRNPEIFQEQIELTMLKDCFFRVRVCVCVFFFFYQKPSKYLPVFSPETVNINKLANLTANTKAYGYITLGIKPHSDLQLMSLKNELPYMSVIILGKIFLFLDDFCWSIF